METYARKIESVIKANWVASDRLKNEVQISIEIVDDGTIYNPKIIKSSGDDQVDGECLAAVCTSSPLNPLPITAITGHSTPLEINFRPNEKPFKIDPSIKQYSALKQLKGRGLAIYKIPPSVINRYPGVIKENEILNSSNLQNSNTSEIVYRSHLWSKFFGQHTHPTRQEIIEGPK